MTIKVKIKIKGRGTGYRSEITLARVENGFKGHLASLDAQTTMTFDMAFDLKDRIQGQWTGYRISSETNVNTRTKMIANGGKPPWAAYTTMILDLAFDL